MRLRLLTLNVWGMPWLLARDLSARLAALDDALPRLDVDVAVFQEAWVAEVVDSLVATGRRCELEYVWHNPLGLGSSGLLVLSKLPIESARFERFALRGLPEKIHHADFYGGKGCVLVTLAGDAGPVVVATTHLQAGYRPRERDEYVALRTGQAVELARLLWGVAEPVVLAGDLNFEESYEEYAVLTGLTGLRDVAATLDKRQRTILPTNPYRSRSTHAEARIDYVFCRDGRDCSVSPRSVERVFDGELEVGGARIAHSDHAGVLVELSVAAGGAPAAVPASEALSLARGLLERGRGEAMARRRRLRFAGAAGLVTAPLALGATRGSAGTRRRFLGALGVGTASLVTALGLGSLALAEWFAPDEIAAYEAGLRSLEEMGP